MPVEFRKEWYTLQACRSEPDKVFVFGDNVERRGKGGQAFIRDEPNAFGIKTKLKPDNNPGSFMLDDNYLTNVMLMVPGFMALEWALERGETVVFPADGLGTGRANLPQGAPKTYQFLCGCITHLATRYGVVGKFNELKV